MKGRVLGRAPLLRCTCEAIMPRVTQLPMVTRQAVGRPVLLHSQQQQHRSSIKRWEARSRASPSLCAAPVPASSRSAHLNHSV